MAQTAEMKPAAIIDTRSQSYAIHRCASSTMSLPLPGPIGEPGAAAYSAVFMGHITTIVKRNTRKISAAEHHSQRRYGVLHPVTRAPTEAIKIVGETEMKNCPGSTGSAARTAGVPAILAAQRSKHRQERVDRRVLLPHRCPTRAPKSKGIFYATESAQSCSCLFWDSRPISPSPN
jgi:hypothetical protein